MLDLDAAQALLRAGETALVFKLLAGRSTDDPPYALVLADAQRASGNFAAALVAYEKLATKAMGVVRVKAGFAAAQLAWHELRDPERALGLRRALRAGRRDMPLYASAPASCASTRCGRSSARQRRAC